MRRIFNILPPSFYDREPQFVAKELLGTLLIRRVRSSYRIGRIVETEAYLPFGDPASHSFRGETKRNASMFKKGGHAYVYRMRHHRLFNVVTEGEDIPGGVLIRAVEPTNGFGENEKVFPIPAVANGPGKVCKAFGITHELDGISVTDPDNELCIAADPHTVPWTVIATTRIGITKGTDLKLRFYIAGNPHVSRKSVKAKRKGGH